MNSIMIKTYCTFDFEGIHVYPDAKDQCRQWYLEYPHRHIFKVKCTWIASHTNRDKEFIDVKHELLEWLQKTFTKINGVYDLCSMSCESLALEILDAHIYLYEVEVSEDGENGAIITKI